VSFSWSDAAFFWPEAIMLLSFLGCILTDLFLRGRRHGPTFAILVVGTVAALVAALIKPPVATHYIFGQMVVADGFSQFFRLLFLVITLITAVFSWSSREIMGSDREHQGEFYSFLAVMAFGMMVMAGANDLVMLALSIELVSLTSYVLAGFARFSLRSSEASLKYVLWGAVSSGVMLYGASIFFGTAASELQARTEAASSGPSCLDDLTFPSDHAARHRA